MKVRLIDELNIASTQGHTNRFDDGGYAGILYYVRAKKSGAVITEAVVGQVRVNYKGDDIVNSNHATLRKYCDLNFGKPLNSQGTSGNYSYYGVYLPFYHPSLPSCIHKDNGENLDFYIEQAQESVDEATCYVYAVLDDLPELYVPRLIELSGTASSGTQKLLVDMPNIASIMITEPSTAPDLIQLLIDNELVYSGNWQILETLTNMVARIESTALDVILLDLVQKGQLNETICDMATLLITGGSGSFNYLINSLKFNPVKTLTTTNKHLSNINTKLAIKGVNNPAVQTSIIRNPTNKSQELQSAIGIKPQGNE